MASSATSHGSVPSSPVHFDSPDPAIVDLRPPPLRISHHKTKTGTDDNVSHNTAASEDCPQSSAKRQCTPLNSAVSEPVSRLRTKTSKLGSLVSKFEILDAVSNADTDSSRIPRISKGKSSSKPSVVSQSTGRRTALPQGAWQRSTTSQEESSDSSDLSPQEVQLPIATARRSKLPVRTRLGTATTEDASTMPLAQQSPRDRNAQSETTHDDPRLVMDRKGLFEQEEWKSSADQLVNYPEYEHKLTKLADSAFKPTKSYLDSNAFRVQQPGQQPEQQSFNTSPRSLPVSKTSKQLRPPTKQAQRRDLPANIDLNLSSPVRSGDEEARSRETRQTWKTHTSPFKAIQHETLSVKSLRKSFEQYSHQQDVATTPVTPAKARDSLSTSIRHSIQKSKEYSCTSHSTDGSGSDSIATPNRQTGHYVATPSTVMARSVRVNLKKSETTGQIIPTSPYPISTRRAPTSLNASGRSRRDHHALLAMSKTFEKVTSSDMSVEDVAAGTVRPKVSEPDLSRGKAARCNEFPHSSPIHPLLHDSSKAAGDEEHLASLLDGAAPQARPIEFTLSRRSKDFGTQTDLSITMGMQPVPKVDAQPGAATYHDSRVSDLRKLFDRAQYKGSSPSSFMSFARRRHQTRPDRSSGPQSPKHDELSEIATSTASSPSSKKTTSPPELTTQISTNDFSCNFLEKSRAPECPPSSIRKAQLGLRSETPPSVTHESPLKHRIKRFEHLQSQSQSYDTSDHHDSPQTSLPSKSKAAVPVIQKASTLEYHHPVRRIWRRISNSLTQSLDGSYGHHHMSTTTSYHHDHSSSVDWDRSPPHAPILPSLLARKSMPFINRLSTSRDNSDVCAFGYDAALHSSRHNDRHGFGLDGAHESKPEVDIFMAPEPSESNLEMWPADSHTVHASQGRFLPPTDELRKRAERQSRRDVKYQKKADKRAKREERHEERKAFEATGRKDSNGKGKQTATAADPSSPSPSLPPDLPPACTIVPKHQRRRISDMINKFEFKREPDKMDKGKGKQPATAVIGDPASPQSSQTLQVGLSTRRRRRGSDSKKKKNKLEEATVEERERNWRDKTASGFVVTQAHVEEIVQPRPSRPHQVRKIVNFYKEKSTSFLRIASGSAAYLPGLGGLTTKDGDEKNGGDGAADGKGDKGWGAKRDGKGKGKARSMDGAGDEMNVYDAYDKHTGVGCSGY
ncbi:hypothetical protein BJ170DRAFT_600334 [Xylariales sp. AK1849]|nr:hypothetical protein BJ170DRAFT_600334 [Xylariales sp. AK1849]